MTHNANFINTLYETTNHTGKMDGMHSISSSCLSNKYCQAYRKDKESICSKCFSCAMHERFGKESAFVKHLEDNTELLKDIIEWDLLPVTTTLIERFESFGDLSCDNHFINFMNICRKNPHTTFAIWTKNPFIIDRVLKSGYEKPSNLIIGLSSRYLNKVADVSKYEYFTDFVFTVFTADYAIENNIDVNCGWRKCIECQRCYTKHDGVMYVNEILKSQLKKYMRNKAV